MLTGRAVFAALALVSMLATAVDGRFHGEDTELRRALQQVKRAEMTEGDVWAYAATAVVVIRFPRRMGLRTADLERSGVAGVPWRPMWISPYVLRLDANEQALTTIRQSRVVLVFRTEDVTKCTVNDLSGARIFSENAEKQDATTVELPCASLPELLEKLQVPLKWNTEITTFVLNSPQVAPALPAAKAEVDRENKKRATANEAR